MCRPQGSANNQVSVVFDGKAEFFGSASDGAIKVIFSQHGSADDLIKEMVEDAAIKSNVVVVSDDKGITLYVRALGAKVLSVKEFARGLFQERKLPVSGKGKAKGSGGVTKEYLSLVKQDKINKELSNIWLKDK